MKRALVVSLIVFGCSSTANRESTIPAAARPRWDACRTTIERYCRERNNGDPLTTSQCEQDAATRYAALTTEPDRATFMTTRGCVQTPPP